MDDKIVNYDVDLTKWNVEKMIGDGIWVWMIDEPESDEVQRASGIVLKTVQTVRGVYRIGKALKVGNKVDVVKEGDYVLIAPGVGQQGHRTKDGYKTAFIAEEKIMAVINFDGNKEEFLKHIKEDLWAAI